MDNLKLWLMHQEALQRLKDAETLAQTTSPGESTNSAYLLELLGLELLLKIVYESALQTPVRGHEYETMFGRLPQHLQSRLLALAGERIGPSNLATDHKSVLEEWGQNFVALRYPWERYEKLNEVQYTSLSNAWASKGAPLKEATFRYHPEELFGFLYALRIVAAEAVSLSKVYE